MLRKRRKELELTQDQVACRMDKDESYVAMLESGARYPPLIVAPRLAAALELDQLELIKLIMLETVPEVYEIVFLLPHQSSSRVC